jgi:hypothetical protein
MSARDLQRIDRLRIELAASEDVEGILNIGRMARKIPGSEAEALAERAEAKATKLAPTVRRRSFVVEKPIKVGC